MFYTLENFTVLLLCSYHLTVGPLGYVYNYIQSHIFRIIKYKHKRKTEEGLEGFEAATSTVKSKRR
jgi:hypothetical protein